MGHEPREGRVLEYFPLMTLLRSVLFGSSLLVLASGPAGAQQTVSNEFFEAKIRPVLAAKCYSCHNSTIKEPKGYLVLDTRSGVMKGGTLGPAIVPGESRRQQAHSRDQVRRPASADAPERQAC